jgi:hypothetical protein
LSRDLHLSRKNLGLGDPSSVATRERESDVYWYSIKYPLHFHVFASCRCCSHRLIAASAKSTVRVITLSTQNCAQSGSQNTRPLPHMNLNVSERLICALCGLSRSTDRVTG